MSRAASGELKALRARVAELEAELARLRAGANAPRGGRDAAKMLAPAGEGELPTSWLQLTFQNSFDGIALIKIPPNTQKRRLVMCNDRYAEMAGRSREELMAADDIMTFVRNNRRPPDYDQRVRGGLPVLGTASWIRPDGRENVFEWLSMWFQAGGETFVAAVDRDVTNRARSERDLARAIQRLDLLMRHAPVGIVVCQIAPDSGKRTLLVCNDHYVRMSGRTRQELAACEDLDTWTTAAQAAPDRARKLAEGRIARGVMGWIRPDGEENYHEYIAAPFELEGAPHVVQIDLDVTERVRTDRELARTAELLQMVMDHSHDGINICRHDIRTGARKLVMCNERYVQMSGRSRSQLFAAADLNQLALVVEGAEHFQERMLAGLPDRGVSRWERPDGRENYYEWNAAPVYLGGELHVVGVDRDITDRLRSEHALQESEAKFRAISEHSLLAVMIVQRGRVQYANQATCDLFGYPLGEMLAWQRGDGDATFHPEDRQFVIQQVQAIQRGDLGGAVCFSHRIVARSGRVKWIEAYYRTMEYGGEPAVLATFVDITGRREAEAALREANQRLIGAEEEVRRYVAAELHDSLGQELVALQLTLRAVLAGGADALGETRSEALTGAADRCGELIGEIRAISRGLFPPVLESLGLCPALRALAKDYGASLKMRIQTGKAFEKLRFAREVETALFRVAQEATRNALQHGNASHATVRLRYVDDWVSLVVTDDGDGFDPLSVDETGMGLKMMRQRALSLGGTMTAESRPGRTSITVRIPSQPLPAPTLRQTRRAGGKRKSQI